jgi:hypothetical protein
MAKTILPNDKKMEIIKIKKMDTFNAKTLRQLLSWGLPFIITTSYLILALQSDLRLAVPTLVGVTAVITILLTVILYAGEKGAVSWSPGVIIIVAIILRILFLFRPPELSDDLYRYLWDGLQVLSGHNPYSTAPLNIQPHNEASYHLLKLINHPDLITIYPPAAQFIFAAGAYLSENFLGLKIVLVAMDLATCALLIKLLSSIGLPAWRAVIYAWHPLPILEIGSSGHIDGAGILFFFLTLVLLRASPDIHSAKSSINSPFQFYLKQYVLPLSAGLTFAWAALIKLLPLFFLPGLFILVKKRNKILFLIGLLTGVTALTLPFLPHLKNMFAILNIYVQNWEFSGFAFRALRRITSSGNSARLILASLFLFSASALYGTLWLKKHPSLRNKTQGCLYDSYLNYWLTPLDKDSFLTVIKALYTITIAYLLLTPTLYPWYALYLVCLLPFTAGAAGLILTWAVFLSYSVLIPYKLLGQWIEDDYAPTLIWLASASAFLLVALTRKLKECKQAKSHLS